MILVEVSDDWPWDVIGVVGHVKEEFPFGWSNAWYGVWYCGWLEKGFSCDPPVGFEEDGVDVLASVGLPEEVAV